MVPVAVLSKERLLLKAARDRRLASGAFRLNASYVRFALRVSAEATLSGSRRRRSGFFAHWALCRWRCYPNHGSCTKQPATGA
ncbi:unnamed protein product [Coccothraustes coccothraustes]